MQDFKTITLDEPIQRGDSLITELTLRRPNAGELRGLSVLNLVQMQTDSIMMVMPRIAEPILTQPELNRMSPADLVQIGTGIAEYFVPKQ